MGLQLVIMRVTAFLLVLILMSGLAEAVLQPGPDCPDRCGNVSIPFPFGIGSSCYLDEGFEVVCNNFKPFIKNISMEVLEINFNISVVRVKSPIIYSKDCQNMTGGGGGGGVTSVDLQGTPFSFSGRNKFTAVGCDNFATMAKIDPMVVGCKSDCNTSRSRSSSTINDNIRCSGFNCCQATIPSGLDVFEADFRSINEDKAGGCSNNYSSKESCKYAFLVEQDWFDSNISDPSSMQYRELQYVPVSLDWWIYNWTGNSSQIIHSLGYTWNNSDNLWTNSDSSSRCTNTSYQNYSMIYCFCGYGYNGNPYLLGGCKDINECEAPYPAHFRCLNPMDCENTPGSYNCNRRKSRTNMAIIGISSSLGAVILLIITWWLYKVIKKRNEIKLKKKFFVLLLQKQLSSSEGNIQNTRLFNSNELQKATDNFNKSRILGQGGQGTVYKGMLVDGRIVAIKKSKIVDEANLEQFVNEIVILSQVIHRNVVKLLGCCLETEVPLLVYEFIPNGTLFQYLHDQNEEFPLTWNVRLRIATEVAGALSYLHSAAALPIYHRDIKSTNILLDDKYRAKVADFGTSRSVTIDQTHLTTLVHGTFGYLDPEYFQTSQFTEKSDVYSFGVVLVELLTGEKPFSFMRSQESRSLANYFIVSIEENNLFDIFDARVMNEGKKVQVMAVANIAKRCLNLNGKKRPTMREVTMELEEIQKASNVQQNYEEFEYVRNEETEPWDFVSTSTGSGFESGTTSSSVVLPLLSLKSL